MCMAREALEPWSPSPGKAVCHRVRGGWGRAWQVEWDTGGRMQEILGVRKACHAQLKWDGRTSAQRVEAGRLHIVIQLQRVMHHIPQVHAWQQNSPSNPTAFPVNSP